MTLVLVAFLLGFSACQTTPAADPTAPGVIFTFAGDDPGFNPDAQTKEEAQFRAINDISVAGDWLYVADSGNHVISRINLTTDELEIIAGNREMGPIPATGDNLIRSPLPPIIQSIDMNPDTNQLYAIFRDSSTEGALVRMDLDEGAYEVLLRKDHIEDVGVLADDQVLFTQFTALYRFDQLTGEARLNLPGVEIITFAAGAGRTAYLATAGDDRVILKADFANDSVEVAAGPFKMSPFLLQVRDDADLLQRPGLFAEYLAVAPGGQVAVLDANRHGASIGLLDPDGVGDFPVIAGTGPHTDTGNGKPATEATISPGPIAFDGAGNLYLATETHIRRINRPAVLN